MTLAEMAQTLGEHEWRLLHLEQENARLQRQITALIAEPPGPMETVPVDADGRLERSVPQ